MIPSSIAKFGEEGWHLVDILSLSEVSLEFGCVQYCVTLPADVETVSAF